MWRRRNGSSTMPHRRPPAVTQRWSWKTSGSWPGESSCLPATTYSTASESLGLPFRRWSVRKLAAYLNGNPDRRVRVGRERVRQLLAANDVTFQRTKSWKDTDDPDRDAKLDPVEEVLGSHPERTFAFDEFGPLAIRPVAGAGWARRGRPQRLRANYHKGHGVRQFHGCYSVGDDMLWGVVRQRKSAANTLAALRCAASAPAAPTASRST